MENQHKKIAVYESGEWVMAEDGVFIKLGFNKALAPLPASAGSWTPLPEMRDALDGILIKSLTVRNEDKINTVKSQPKKIL